MKASNFFTYNETVKTDTGLKNEPSISEKENILYAAARLDSFRLSLGRLKVNSWFRSEKVNSAVGGSNTSSHKLGLAIDIVPLDMSVEKAYEIIKSCGLSYDQAILYKTFIHIGFKKDFSKERKQNLKG